MLDIKEFLQGDVVLAEGTFQHMLAVARENYYEGNQTSFEGVQVDFTYFKGNTKKYFDYLVGLGAISTTYKPTQTAENGYADTSHLKSIPDIFEEEQVNGETVLVFDTNNLKRLGKEANYFRNGPGYFDISKSLLARYWLASRGYINGQRGDRFIYRLDSKRSKSVPLYADIKLMQRSIPWVRDEVLVETFGVFDEDYILFSYESLETGTYRKERYTNKEKLQLLKQNNIEEGSVVILVSRSHFSENTFSGTVTGTNLIRIDSITETKIEYSVLPENGYGLNVATYEAIYDDLKPIFRDLIKYQPFKPNRTQEDLLEIGINTAFSDEEYLLVPMNPYEVVTKPVYCLGEVVEMTMTAPDYLYWVLEENDIDFNKSNFKHMYGLESTSWERVNEDA